MIAFDLKPLGFVGLLALAGAALLAVALDRRRFRDQLLARTGAAPAEARRALEGAPFGLLLLGPHRRCLYANAEARRMLGLATPAGELPPAPWREALEQDLAEARPQYRTLALPGDQSLGWWTCPLPEVNFVFLTDQSGPHQAERATRMFLGNLCHELRTPLTAIVTHLEVLRAPEIPGAAREASLDVIRQEAERISRLVRDLLELNRLEITSALERRPVDLLLVAEQAVAEVILGAEARSISLSLQADTPLPRVLGDPDRLKQLFLIVLDNAVKYSRPGDSVDVTLKAGPEGNRATIRDCGPGISPEHLPHVTERLYRGRTDVPGSGLGLTLAGEILRQHRSHLVIESPPAGEPTGTAVSFRLPTAEP